jgi:N-acetyl-anhydromuramyl-L-alanine amidase AmpD
MGGASLMSKLMLLVILQLVRDSVPNMISPNGVVIHHTALTSEDLRQFSGQVKISTIDLLHKRRGYQVYFWGKTYYAGYHYLILPDGTVDVGRPENCIGSHTRGHNQMIGIALVGNFSSRELSNELPLVSEPTPAQLHALAQLISDIRRRYEIPCDRIYRHYDLNPETLCPGDSFPWQNLRMSIGCVLATQ